MLLTYLSDAPVTTQRSTMSQKVPQTGVH